MLDRLIRLKDCAATTFAPALGDRDPLNLTLLAGYVLATVLAALILRQRPFPAVTRRRETVLWAFGLFILAALTLNKELDLQTWLTDTGRCLARAEGWYAARRAAQIVFSAYLLSATCFLGFVALFGLRGTWARSTLPFLGLLLLFGFIGLRVVSFHHLDQVFRIEVSSVRLHRIIEAGGLILILLGEMLLLRRPRPADA